MIRQASQIGVSLSRSGCRMRPVIEDTNKNADSANDAARMGLISFHLIFNILRISSLCEPGHNLQSD